MRCLWCGEPIAFRGAWRHESDDTTIRTRIREDGAEVDDHVATPDYNSEESE